MANQSLEKSQHLLILFVVVVIVVIVVIRWLDRFAIVNLLFVPFVLDQQGLVFVFL
jgi:uncharacterized membrane protein